MMGMHVTDSWKLADYHKIINYSTKSNKRPMTIQRFGGVLGRQLIHYASTCSKAQPHQPQSEKENIPPSLTSDSFSFNMSSLSDNLVDGSSPTVLIPICSLADCQGVVHHQVKLPIQVGKNGKRYTKQRPCSAKEEVINEILHFTASRVGYRLVSAVQLKKQQGIALRNTLMK
jgi:hypothetical protein